MTDFRYEARKVSRAEALLKGVQLDIEELDKEQFEDIFKPSAEVYYKQKLKEMYDKLPKEVFIDMLSYDTISQKEVHTRQYIS